MIKGMFDFSKFDVDEDLEEEFEKLSDDEIKNNINTYSVEKLSDIVIANRYLGLFQDFADLAMEELGKRRVAGNTFEYEKYIDDNLSKLPKLDFMMPNVMDLISKLKDFKK